MQYPPASLAALVVSVAGLASCVHSHPRLAFASTGSVEELPVTAAPTPAARPKPTNDDEFGPRDKRGRVDSSDFWG